MLKLVYMRLTADVALRRNEGKVKWLSDVSIKLDGGRVIARKTLGGRYTSHEALKEFGRNPLRFETQAPFLDAGFFVNGVYKPGLVYEFGWSNDDRGVAA